jgi:predicted thioesterase
MNLEIVSQVSFTTSFSVAPAHTASAYFAGLPHGARYASRLADVLCSGHLLAQLESVCMEAMHDAIDWERELVLGASMALQHRGPAVVGERVEARGMVIGIDPRRVLFHVDAHVDERLVAEGEVRFAIVERARHAAWASARPQQHIDSALPATASTVCLPHRGRPPQRRAKMAT